MHLVICVGLSWWMTFVSGQRAPCYQCEMYKDSHPHSHPYSVVRAHCVYPCKCGAVPQCSVGVPVIRDGCGCCWQCAKMLEETCDGVNLCDSNKNLFCHYKATSDATGVCKELTDSRCRANGRKYKDGQTFKIDCRTECICQNGTYACASLCPGESIPPSSQCHHPHLVSVPGQCCREWMCDIFPDKAGEPPDCAREAGPWSPCSLQTCGIGVSVRWSTDNNNCQVFNQTRLCQLRPCHRWQNDGHNSYQHRDTVIYSKKHHIRRSHTCKATQRLNKPVRLQVGWCVSERRYRMKQCASCTNRCCTVFTSTTITVAFLCPLHSNTDLLAGRKSRELSELLFSSRVDENEKIVTTTHEPSVYDMMDEGQPIMDETLNFDQQRQQPVVEEAFLFNYPDYPETATKDPFLKNSDEDHEHQEENLVHFAINENENLTTDDESAYERIRKDNHKIVHHRVEWIRRCKCKPKCDAENIYENSYSQSLRKLAKHGS